MSLGSQIFYNHLIVENILCNLCSLDILHLRRIHPDWASTVLRPSILSTILAKDKFQNIYTFWRERVTEADVSSIRYLLINHGREDLVRGRARLFQQIIPGNPERKCKYEEILILMIDNPSSFESLAIADLLDLGFRFDLPILIKKLYDNPDYRAMMLSKSALSAAYREKNLDMFARVVQYPSLLALALVRRITEGKRLSWLAPIASSDCTFPDNQLAKFAASYASGLKGIDDVIESAVETLPLQVTLLEIACNIDAKSDVFKLLEVLAEDQSIVDSVGIALCYAAKRGHLDLIEHICTKDPEFLLNDHRAFEVAAKHRQFAAYRRLLTYPSLPFLSKLGIRFLVEKGPEDLIEQVFSQEMLDKHTSTAKITSYLFPAVVKKRLHLIRTILTHQNTNLRFYQWFYLLQFALKDQDIKQVVLECMRISEEELISFSFLYAATLGKIKFIRTALSYPCIPLDHREIYANLLKKILSARSKSPYQFCEDSACQGILEAHMSNVFVPYAQEKKFSLLLDFIKSFPAYAKYID